jgi:ribosomal protein S18 acetylase RimI-like enzyme
LAENAARFVLRRLGRDDWVAWRALRLEALRTHPECFGAAWEAESRQPAAWFAERLDSNHVIGGWRADVLAGVAGVQFPASAKQRHKATLWGMYVRPEARRLGLATALVEAAVAAARGRVEEVRLAVVATNAAALALYRAAGFRAYATDPRALKVGDAYYDDVLMVLRFGAPAAERTRLRPAPRRARPASA